MCLKIDEKKYKDYYKNKNNTGIYVPVIDRDINIIESIVNKRNLSGSLDKDIERLIQAGILLNNNTLDNDFEKNVLPNLI